MADSYAESIKAIDPTLYNQMAQYLAHSETTPGVITDQWAQLLTPLNVNQFNAPKSIAGVDWQTLKSQGA